MNDFNNFYNPVSHDVSREDLEAHANTMVSTGYAISAVGQEVHQTYNSIESVRQDITVARDEIRNIVSKSKKKKGGCELVKGIDKYVMLQSYSDGSTSAKEFFTNVSSAYTGTIFRFPEEIAKSEIVQILFDEKVPVIFFRKNVNGTKLYQAFLTAGVHFNSEIPVGVIKRELEKFVLTVINVFPVQLIIPVAGWGERNWFHTGRDYTVFAKWAEFPVLPVMSKIFPYIGPEKRQTEDYFKLANQIKDVNLMRWTMLYPFFSLISSLLKRCKCELDYCLNIVTDDEDVRREICKRMAIFNRENVPIISLEEKKSSLNNEFSKYGDEVIFLSADKPEMRDYNVERKLQTNIEYAINILAKKRNLPSPYSRPVYASAVIFTNYPLALRGVRTIYADRDDFDIFHANDYIVYDWLYQEFIRYIGTNYDKIIQYLKKAQPNASEENGMRCLVQIMDEFWKSKKINIFEKLKGTNNLDSLTDEMCSRAEFVDEIEMFRILVRKAIRNIPVYKAKSQVGYQKNFCVYTEDYLLIPVKLFNQWLENENVTHIKKKVLAWLSSNGYLKTHERYIYKFQSAGSRCDTYCISLNFFNKVGEIPVEKLGGSKANVIR